MGRQIRHKVPKRRVKAKLHEDRTVATQLNQTWTMDFVHDQLAIGRKLRVLTVVNTFSRFCPVLDAQFRYRGEDVVETLEGVCRRARYPRAIWVDQGSEFISRNLDVWAYYKGGSSTSPGQGSRPTTPSSILQREVPHGVPERPLVHEP